MNSPALMPPFPFALPRVTRGFAELSPEARRIGAAVAEAISAALASVLGERVVVAGTASPGEAARAAGVASVRFALPGGDAGSLDVDAGLLGRVLDRVTGGACAAPAALAPTDVERMLLALLALVAADAASAVAALAPRVLLEEEQGTARAPSDDLAIALALSVGDERGRGALRLPPGAVRALRTGEATRAAAVEIDASWRQGSVSLAPDELAALACGDVLVLDAGIVVPELVLPGGLMLRGRAEAGVFQVEEIRMTEARVEYPITLSVEIARVSISLGELARLEPGAALALGARKDGAVVLRAGEQAVARGQLVEIDGALGVRIAQLGAFP